MPRCRSPTGRSMPRGRSPSAATMLDQRRALLCLTQAVYYEAGFEPLEGRRAVAQVVLNRMRHPAFPKSVCGVVYQGATRRVCQFTFVCDGSLYRAPGARRPGARPSRSPAPRSPAMSRRRSGEATHYHADYVAPRWAPMLPRSRRSAQHIFYRWPGAWGQPAAFTGRYIGEPRDPLSMRPASAGDRVSRADATPASPQARCRSADRRAPTTTSAGCSIPRRAGRCSIPGPDESGGAAAQADRAQQEHKPRPQPRSRRRRCAGRDRRALVEFGARLTHGHASLSSDPRSGTASR